MSLQLHQHLEKLSYFATIAETGSFSAAANRLRITQPALSRSVKALEDLLGVAVLKRDRNGATLTESGKTLLTATRAMLDLIKKAEQDIRGHALPMSKPLRMGTKEPFAIHVWPSYLLWLRDQPHTPVHSLAESMWLSIDKLNAVQWQKFLDNKVDLVLLVEPPKHKKVAATPLFYSEMRLYQRGRVARQKYGGTTPASELPLLVYGEAIIGPDSFLNAFVDKQRTKRRIVDVQSFDAAREMTMRGLGICILPHWVAADGVRQDLLEELPLDFLGAKTINVPKSMIYLCASLETAAMPVFPAFAKNLQKFCRATF